jgi:hypothetical protein
VKRFPLYVFAGLVAATVAAFFITQAVKVTTPFVGGFPTRVPAAINPVDGGTCTIRTHLGRRRASFRSTRISFYLQYRPDDVNMYVVDVNGTIVRTVASDRYMAVKVRRTFFWNGRESDGSVAPDGTYYFQVALVHQGRAIDVGGPIHVLTSVPHPVITGVSPNLAAGSTPVTIHFTGAGQLGSTVLIYRTDTSGKPRLVDRLRTTHRHMTTWNGTIDGLATPAGTYLIGLSTTDRACTTGQYPIVVPPAPGSTPHAGLTIRYLAAEPPLDPVRAGTPAIVNVDSRTRPYRWTLALWAARKPVAHGRGTTPGAPLSVRLPRGQEGLYVLSLRSGSHSTAVPIVASTPSRARILVVLPALTWQGLNPVDDTGDGLPSTLAAGVPIQLNRVFANGLPAGLGDEAGLLTYLNHEHLGYDLTTDVGLLDGVGSPLTAYRGVVLAGSERWLPASTTLALQSYVQHGGHVLSLGIGSLESRVATEQTPTESVALQPTPPSATDALGAHRSPVVHTSLTILQVNDGLGIFQGTSMAFPGFNAYEPIAPPSPPLSAAGPTSNSFAIVGYRDGSGFVVDIGLVGFGSSLRHDVDAQELVSRLWTVLAR